MTREYAQHLAQTVLPRLNGVEKMLLGEDQLVITINPDNTNMVQGITTSVSGARTVFTFVADGDALVEQGKMILDAYGQEVS